MSAKSAPIKQATETAGDRYRFTTAARSMSTPMRTVSLAIRTTIVDWPRHMEKPALIMAGMTVA